MTQAQEIHPEPAPSRRERHLAAADKALAEGDDVTARIILSGVAYSDRYSLTAS